MGTHPKSKSMEGQPAERAAIAREAREHGKKPSEVGATTGASKQRTKSDDTMTHQQKVDLEREGKVEPMQSSKQNTPEARPGSRDPDTPDQEIHPRM